MLGVTVVLLICSYRDKEFVRVGYYVNNEYKDEEMKANPPAAVDFSSVARSILADKPRVTRFSIPWYGGVVAGISALSAAPGLMFRLLTSSPPPRQPTRDEAAPTSATGIVSADALAAASAKQMLLDAATSSAGPELMEEA